MDILDHALLEAAKSLDLAEFERLLAELAGWYVDAPDEWQIRVERARRRAGHQIGHRSATDLA